MSRPCPLANPMAAAVFGVVSLLAPVIVGINISPAPLFRDRAIRLRY